MRTTFATETGMFSPDFGRGAGGWFIALGAVLVVLGLAASANLFLATFAATFMVGVMMAIGGVLQLMHAFAVRRWTWSLLWGLAGLLYLAAAAALVYDPLLAAAVLTLWLVAGLGVSGAIRIAISLGDRGRGWGWMLASGIASVAAAAMVGLGWPMNVPWVLGLVLSIDLLFQGAMLVMIGFGLRAPRD